MKTLAELDANDCRYPFGESDFTFCAKPKHVYMRLDRLCISPYCHEHYLICVVEPLQKKVAA